MSRGRKERKFRGIFGWNGPSSCVEQKGRIKVGFCKYFMTILIWDEKGLGNSKKWSMIKEKLKKAAIDAIILQETKRGDWQKGDRIIAERQIHRSSLIWEGCTNRCGVRCKGIQSWRISSKGIFCFSKNSESREPRLVSTWSRWA